MIVVAAVNTVKLQQANRLTRFFAWKEKQNTPKDVSKTPADKCTQNTPSSPTTFQRFRAPIRELQDARPLRKWSASIEPPGQS